MGVRSAGMSSEACHLILTSSRCTCKMLTGQLAQFARLEQLLSHLLIFTLLRYNESQRRHGALDKPKGRHPPPLPAADTSDETSYRYGKDSRNADNTQILDARKALGKNPFSALKE